MLHKFPALVRHRLFLCGSWSAAASAASRAAKAVAPISEPPSDLAHASTAPLVAAFSAEWAPLNASADVVVVRNNRKVAVKEIVGDDAAEGSNRSQSPTVSAWRQWSSSSLSVRERRGRVRIRKNQILSNSAGAMLPARAISSSSCSCWEKRSSFLLMSFTSSSSTFSLLSFRLSSGSPAWQSKILFK